MIRFACPSCSATYAVSDDKGGRTMSCPKCKTQFEVPPAPKAAASAPPAKSPPPSKANEPVTIEPCPKCKTQLSVEPGDLGSDVECPTCQKVFKARKAGSKAVFDDFEVVEDDEPPKKKKSGMFDELESEKPKKSSKRSAFDDDEEEDQERPRSRRRRDEDDFDDRPRRKKGRRRRGGSPHRGGLILTLGILSFVLCGIFTGLPAMIMGGNDLKEMDAGRMDDEGRTMTLIGRILGIVSVALTVIGVLFYCVAFAIIGAAGVK